MGAKEIAKLANRLRRLQRDLRKEGLGEVADKIRDPMHTLVMRGLDAFHEEKEEQ